MLKRSKKAENDISSVWLEISRWVPLARVHSITTKLLLGKNTDRLTCCHDTHAELYKQQLCDHKATPAHTHLSTKATEKGNHSDFRNRSCWLISIFLVNSTTPKPN